MFTMENRIGSGHGCGAPRIADSDGTLNLVGLEQQGGTFATQLRKEYGRRKRVVSQQSAWDRRELFQRGGE